jgi:quercetin dioxygenase-like cupin family protein
MTNFLALNRIDLPYDGSVYEFEGTKYQDTDVSFIWVDMLPGGNIRLHKHPYKEIFIILEGVSTFTVGNETIQAKAGEIIIVPADVPHKFSNDSDKQLKQVDIHVSNEFITIWLEDKRSAA